MRSLAAFRENMVDPGPNRIMPLPPVPVPTTAMRTDGVIEDVAADTVVADTVADDDDDDDTEWVEEEMDNEEKEEDDDAPNVVPDEGEDAADDELLYELLQPNTLQPNTLQPDTLLPNNPSPPLPPPPTTTTTTTTRPSQLTPLPDVLSDSSLLDASMCPKGANGFHNLACCKGECQNCPKLDWSIKPEAKNKTVRVKRYCKDPQTERDDIIVLNMTMEGMVDQVKSDLATQKIHDATAKIQKHAFTERIRISKNNPNLNMVVMSTDWAERMALLQKDETMSMHWGTTQVRCQ